MLDTKYLCCADIIGIKIKPDTVIETSHFIFTNSPKYIFQNLIPDMDLFFKKYGDVITLSFVENHCFLFNNINHERSDAFHHNNQFIAGLLEQLWTIRDNGVFAMQFFYIPVDTSKNYILQRLNFFKNNSKGQASEVDFNDNEIRSMLQKVIELQVFIAPKGESTEERLHDIRIHTAQTSIPYNNITRVERALLFLSNARTLSMLPIKITNYISFLECLFSTSGTEISHQVAERAALFMNSHNNEINKIETYKFIKNCYSIRSKYIHGAKLDNKHKELLDLQIFSEKLDCICREVINNILSKKLLFFNDEKLLEEHLLNLIFGS